MDVNASPCDDFYKFACGKYDKETVIPDDQSSANTFTVMRNNLNEKLRLVLDVPAAENDIPLFKKIKKFYNLCLNKTAIENLGAVPILNLFKSIGGFPVLEKEWDESKFSWFELLKKFRMIGLTTDYLFDFAVAIDMTNSSRRRIEVRLFWIN